MSSEWNTLGSDRISDGSIWIRDASNDPDFAGFVATVVVMASNWEVRRALKDLRKNYGEGLAPSSVRAYPVLMEGYENAAAASAALIDLCSRVESRDGDALKCAFRLPPYTIHGIDKRRRVEGEQHMGKAFSTVHGYENNAIDALTHLITGDDGPLEPEGGYSVDPSLRISPEELEFDVPLERAHLLINPAEFPIAVPKTWEEAEADQRAGAAGWPVDRLVDLNERLVRLIERQDLRISELEDALNRFIADQGRKG